MTEPVIYVVDDDPSIRSALSNLLRSANMRVIAFGSTREFLAAPMTDEPNCMLLDVRLPDQSGLEFQAEMKKLGLHVPTVFITGHGDIPMAVQAIRAGASEFLTKPFSDADLLRAVNHALQADETSRARRLSLYGLRERHQALTPREREVLNLLVEGYANKQIAAELGVQHITVKVHRAQCMRKMQAGSFAELVRMVDALKSTPSSQE
ncbi:response regulator transcription factor [Terrarubrum flagellatum]|uniref:response regulator transcription factor n=1 Tax=Terrirubrum flagellatum TaxID=2895980 RepID=UPI003145706C